MIPVSRMTDIGVGVCTSHPVPIPMTGIILASAAKVFCDGLQVALDGDIVVGGCGHTGVLIASTSVLYVEGRRAVRLGDTFAGAFSGTIAAGSPVTFSK